MFLNDLTNVYIQVVGAKINFYFFKSLFLTLVFDESV